MCYANVDCEQSLFSSKIRGKERKTGKRASVTQCQRDLGAAMPRAASSVDIGRRVKRETALVSYNDLAISFPESTCLLVSTKTRSSGIINFQRPRF